MTSRKKSTSKPKSKRTQIDLGRTANTRIVIDTTPDKVKYQKLPRMERTRGRKPDDIPRGTSPDKIPNNMVRVAGGEDPRLGLNHRFRHGYPHAVQLTFDRRTFLQLQKFANEEIRTPTGAVRQIIIDATKDVTLNPTIDVDKEEEILNAS